MASSRPEVLARRQVDLGRVAGDDHLALLAEPREEHLELHRRAVLRLIEDDNGMRERAPAHEGERRDLDHAGGEAALDPLRRQHVVKRVVERPQIRIDLLAHVARQKAEPLAGLDRRPRQDQPVASPALQAGRGEGDGEIGLARAGGAGGEDEIFALHRGKKRALRRRPRRDQPLSRADLLRFRRLHGLVVDLRLEVPRMADGADDFSHADHLPLSQSGA